MFSAGAADRVIQINGNAIVVIYYRWSRDRYAYRCPGGSMRRVGLDYREKP
jgi:hypothetical protein